MLDRARSLELRAIILTRSGQLPASAMGCLGALRLRQDDQSLLVLRRIVSMR